MWHEKLYLNFYCKVVKFHCWTPCKCIFCFHRAKDLPKFVTFFLNGICRAFKQHLFRLKKASKSPDSNIVIRNIAIIIIAIRKSKIDNYHDLIRSAGKDF